MKIFVTGGTGVVGRPTVAGLLARGHEVRAAARSERAATSLRAAGAEPVDVDLFDPHSVRDAVVGADAVAHLATNVPPFPAMLKPAAWEMHNRLRTDATRNLVDAARAAGVPRFLKESITIVYADGGPEWLDERSPVAAAGLMAPTLEGERIALELGDVATVVVLRFGLFYGGVDNRGTARPAPRLSTGAGHGLVGMRERVAALGGRFAAGPRPGGSFRVTAHLPLTVAA